MLIKKNMEKRIKKRGAAMRGEEEGGGRGREGLQPRKEDLLRSR